MNRKLASIRKVTKIESIEGADFIELAHIDGWKCIVKKGEFQKDDSGVFFEIDSLLPESDYRFYFLAKRGVKILADGSRGYRLKSSKLRDVLSQGLLLPTKEFPELGTVVVGQDVTDKLGVKLYEAPIPAQLSGEVKGNFPEFLNKTDQERIQNLPEFWEKCKDVEFEESEKLDGTLCTMFWNEGTFGVCSRNLELKENDKNTYWKAARKINIEKHLSELNLNIALSGELCGEGIQKNKYKLVGQHFFVFDIWDIDKREYVTFTARKELISWRQ